MYSIQTGKIGEIAVQKNLLLQNFNVYIPLVDSGVDLVVELQNCTMQKVQVKGLSEMKKRTSIEVNLAKYKNTGQVLMVQAEQVTQASGATTIIIPANSHG